MRHAIKEVFEGVLGLAIFILGPWLIAKLLFGPLFPVASLIARVLLGSFGGEF